MNVHAMTGRERILAVLAGQKTDRIPCMPITMMFAADILGVKYGQYVRDHRILAQAQAKTAEMFGFDYVSAISDPAREATDLGAKIQWYEDRPPAIIEEEALFAGQVGSGATENPPRDLWGAHGRPRQGNRAAAEERGGRTVRRGMG